MKKIKLFSLFVVAILAIMSCEEKGDFLTENINVGGLITPTKKAVAYVVGNGDTFEYKEVINVVQATNVQVVKINIYKRFTDSKGTSKTDDDKFSNEILLRSLDVPANVPLINIPFSVTYPQLIQGLSVAGVAVPTVDTGLNIGDAFVLRYEQVRSDGKTVESSQSVDFVTKIGVGTRYSGKYKVIQGEYWRINVPRPDVIWVGQDRIIEAVNASTYRMVGFAGPFASTPTNNNTHFFSISSTGIVATPLAFDGATQLLNGFGVINCVDTPTSITNACGFAGPQNIVVNDNVNGKDRIYRTYGYFTTGSGPREIYEVLEKIVE